MKTENGVFIDFTQSQFEFVNSSSIAFSDIDGDGDQDVLITGSSSSGSTSKLYTNDDAFLEVTGTSFEGVSWFHRLFRY
jgi:hypothetical protein